MLVAVVLAGMCFFVASRCFCSRLTARASAQSCFSVVTLVLVSGVMLSLARLVGVAVVVELYVSVVPRW